VGSILHVAAVLLTPSLLLLIFVRMALLVLLLYFGCTSQLGPTVAAGSPL
jgi:hypothetical protein